MTKKRFSFTRLLYNDKIMMIVSLLLATAIWLAVISGPANIEERPITVSVTIDLTNSYAAQSGLHVIGEDTFDVKVTVSGAWSVITKLNEEDLRVRPDLTAVTGAGDVEIPLNVSRNSSETDYDILAVTPNAVTVTVDYWRDDAVFDIETDVTALTAVGENAMIGEPFVDKTLFPDGKAAVSGPKTVVDRIETLVAKVTTPEELTAMKQYQVPLSALDAQGNEVDLSQCEIRGFTADTVTLTVPIWEERHVELGYTVKNLPDGYSQDELLTLEPASLDLLGPAEELNALETELADLGVVDVTKLSVSNNTVTFDLKIPQTVRVIGAADSVKVTMNTAHLAQKSVSLQVTGENTVVSGALHGLSASIREQTLENVLLVGDASAINAISAAALTVEVELGDTALAGTQQYYARIVVNGYDDVWACYGDAEGIPLYVTLS